MTISTVTASYFTVRPTDPPTISVHDQHANVVFRLETSKRNIYILMAQLAKYLVDHEKD